jgi:hypothetical protein
MVMSSYPKDLLLFASLQANVQLDVNVLPQLDVRQGQRDYPELLLSPDQALYNFYSIFSSVTYILVSVVVIGTSRGID